jgi:hypothetical protein
MSRCENGCLEERQEADKPRRVRPNFVIQNFVIQNRLGPTKMPCLDEFSPSCASHARNTSAKSIHNSEVGQEKFDASETETYAYICDRCMGEIAEEQPKLSLWWHAIS